MLAKSDLEPLLYDGKLSNSRHADDSEDSDDEDMLEKCSDENVQLDSYRE